MKKKLFISHASEDKPSLVEPLTTALKEHFDVWLDKEQLAGGDSLREGINQGLTWADYGVVIVSSDYLRKYWTREELQGLTSIESSKGKVIIPVRWKVSVEDIKKHDPMLAGRVMIDGESGVASVVHGIRLATDTTSRGVELSRPSASSQQLEALAKSYAFERLRDMLCNSSDGVEKANSAGQAVLDRVHDPLQLQNEAGTLGFTIKREERSLLVYAPESIVCAVTYANPNWSSVNDAVLHWIVYEYEPSLHSIFSSPKIKKTFRDACCRVTFDEAGDVSWTTAKESWSSTELAECILSVLVYAMKTLRDKRLGINTPV
jgi:hypothetical protein